MVRINLTHVLAWNLSMLSEIVKDSEFKVFASTVANGGQVKGINVKQSADAIFS